MDVRKFPTKISIGIILCRINPISKNPEVLLVHKRYTYAYSDFIQGHYPSNPQSLSFLPTIQKLFENMTIDELLDIMSLKFSQMWYRIWLNRNTKTEFYHKKYHKFYSIFMKDDGGRRLRRILQDIRCVGTVLWEIPKGRRSNPSETDIICAVREFQEETYINKNMYHILPNIKQKSLYISEGLRYLSIFYVAVANRILTHSSIYYSRSFGQASIKDMACFGEISESKWFDIESLRLVDEHGRIEHIIKPALNIAKKYAYRVF